MKAGDSVYRVGTLHVNLANPQAVIEIEVGVVRGDGTVAWHEKRNVVRAVGDLDTTLSTGKLSDLIKRLPAAVKSDVEGAEVYVEPASAPVVATPAVVILK